MKKRFRNIILCFFTISSFLCGCQTQEADITSNEQSASDNNETESDASDTIVSPPFPENMLVLCDNYFKGGDYNWKLTITPADPEYPNQLYVYAEDSVSRYQVFSLVYDDSTNSWPLKMQDGGNFPEAQYTLEQKKKGSVLLVCNDKEQITYDSYYSQDMLTMPDAFTRPLNASDLLTLDKEQMGIIRNEFYAVHGRKFTSKNYQDYFLNLDWYVPLTDAEDFSDAVLSNLQKRNIKFLTEAEAAYDDNVYQDKRAVYTALSEAPYFKNLQEGEISIHLDSTSAKDMDLYYIATGSIGIPATVTEEEYHSLKQGNPLEICVNDLTGKTITITRSENTAFSGYDEGNPYIIIDGDAYLDAVNFDYQPYQQNYRLWIASDDTIFKTVYEGDIFVLKGACAEYFHNFEYYESPLTEQPFVYQIMDFDEEPSGFGMDYYYGNRPVFDEKGYLKALYFYGD